MEKKGDQLAHNISRDGRGDEQAASCVYRTPVVMTESEIKASCIPKEENL